MAANIRDMTDQELEFTVQAVEEFGQGRADYVNRTRLHAEANRRQRDCDAGQFERNATITEIIRSNRS
jgi:hypothetical protein